MEGGLGGGGGTQIKWDIYIYIYEYIYEYIYIYIFIYIFTLLINIMLTDFHHLLLF